MTAGVSYGQILDSEQQAFLTLINNYRAQNGVGPLQISATLQNASQWMSNDMATQNYFSHTDSLGRAPDTRMQAFGYPQNVLVGENNAAGDSDAQHNFTGWQTECDPDVNGNCTFAHNQNMLNPNFVAIGIGRAPGGTFGWYWTTDFGAMLDKPLTPQGPSVFVPITPCRVVDTRASQNFPAPFGAPSLVGGGTARPFPIPASTKCVIPVNAVAYSFNVTVIPPGPLGYLVISPSGRSRPNAVTLDDLQAQILNTAAIVPAGPNGWVDVFTSNNTDLVIDINGYFVVTPPPSGSVVFMPMTPCRVVDTRASQNFPAQFGAPSLVGGGATLSGGPTRTFPIRSSATCTIPSNAMAYSFNVTVIPPGSLGFLTLWPTGQGRPNAVTIDDVQGQILNIAAIVPGGTNGSVDVFASANTDMVLDINGVFVPGPASSTSLLFVPVPPCRVVDTRASQNFPAQFGAPSLVGGGYVSQTPKRTFPIQSSTNCSIPANAKAYSFNATVIPPGQLGFLVIWPTGQVRPNAVTIDDLQGQIVNNLVIVQGGTNGSVDVFASENTDLVLDINGYFIPGP